MALRLGKGTAFTAQNMKRVESYLDEREILRLLTSKSLSGKRVFVCDMTDLFGEWVPDALIDRLWAVFALRPDVTWQVLTKRPERMASLLLSGGFEDVVVSEAMRLAEDCGRQGQAFGLPLANVWAGVSAEDNSRWGKRIGHLLRTPATVRFVSYEPALGPLDPWPLIGVDLRCRHGNFAPEADSRCQPCRCWPDRSAIDWLICGGESGQNARPMELDWARSVRDQCRAAGVAFWFKQQSGLRPGANPTLDGREWHEFPQTAVPLVPVPKEQGALL